MARKIFLAGPGIVVVVLSFVGILIAHADAANSQVGNTWGLPLPSVVQQMPPAKQHVVQTVAAEQIAASQHPAAPKNSAPPLASCPSSLPQPEILTSSSIPSASPIQAQYTLNGVSYTINNGAILEDHALNGYQVSAGALASNSAQGVLIVIPINFDICKHPNFTSQPMAYPTKALMGSITITGVNDDILAFVTSKGITGHFNLAMGVYQ